MAQPVHPQPCPAADSSEHVIVVVVVIYLCD